MLKGTPQGGLIYLTLALFLVAAVLLRGKFRAVGRNVWFLGFVSAVASVVYRGVHTGHPPMQNLFEFFLCIGGCPVCTPR